MKELSAAEAALKEQHEKITSEIFEILAMTRDKVSDKCIENLHDWKVAK